MDSAIESSKSAKSGMKFKSVEDIDAEIAKLEKTQVPFHTHTPAHMPRKHILPSYTCPPHPFLE